MAKRCCSFNDDWLKEQEWSLWLERGSNVKTAYCKLCNHSFDVSNMGKSAVASHAKGKKHKEKISLKKSLPIHFFSTNNGLSSSTNDKHDDSCRNDGVAVQREKGQSTDGNEAPMPQQMMQSSLSSYVHQTSVTEAEILWVLRTVLCHNSLRSCDGLSELFQRMFNDSTIAKSFSLGRTKCGYLVNFGIAPYFKEQLLLKLKSSPCFVACYDESLNRTFQEEQMDTVVKYFDDVTGLVETRYLTSAFLKRPNSSNLHDKLLESLSSLDLGKMRQLSMDGPNVNWDVLKINCQYREENEHPKLINIGSCGLHVMHGALRTGTIATVWEIHKVLHAMWKIFDESPARRDIYMRETSCDILPLHFCKTRWIEDEPVAERAIQIWPNIVKLVKYWLTLPASKRPKNNKSYETLLKYHTDPLIVVKLHFFKYIASLLKPFLVQFQTNKPMLPFLANELDTVLRRLMSLFVR